jgi:hypothetical protein
VRHPATALEFEPLLRCGGDCRIAVLKASRIRRHAVQAELKFDAVRRISQNCVHLIVQFSQPPESHHLI